jgi:serine/threonine-protein kinase
MSDLIGQLFAGRYQIEQQLGQGGMGTVYLATQRGLGRKVAVKVLNANISSNAEQQRRFESEARLSASLTHPHIVSIFDYGIENRVNYVAMPFIAGGTLSQRYASIAQSNNPLPALHETSAVISQIASALGYAHSRGIIHRDVKPSNIMFDEQGNAFLTDFGIARLIAATTSFTMTGAQIGTPMYMPPEQWEGKGNLSQATDQYALAVMTFQLITNELPFKADTITAMMHAHIYEAPLALQTYRADLPQAITDVIHKALSKNQDDRYPSTIEFANAFDKAIQGIDTEAPTLFFQTLIKVESPNTPNDESILITQPIPHYGKAKSRNRYSFLILIGVILLIGGVVFAMTISQSPATEIAQDNVVTEPTASNEDSIAAIAIADVSTPTTTNTPSPTHTSTATQTPTPNLDIEATTLAEILTSDSQIVQTQQFFAGATQTHVAQLSLTPAATDTPIPMTVTPDVAIAIQRAQVGVTSNTQWTTWYPEGVMQTFDDVEMMLVPAGCFMMGSSPDDVNFAVNILGGDRQLMDDEQPEHEQCINAPYWIDKYEVDQSNYVRLGGTNLRGNCFPGNNSPVECMTWFEAQTFCQKRGGRLPTELEWEYAASGPSDLYFPWGNEWNADVLVWKGNSSNVTASVGNYPNGRSWIGAYDMAGNVWEWVDSVYRDYPYSQSSLNVASPGDRIVLRGGSWLDNPASIRTSNRIWDNPIGSLDRYGFRCVRS